MVINDETMYQGFAQDIAQFNISVLDVVHEYCWMHYHLHLRVGFPFSPICAYTMLVQRPFG